MSINLSILRRELPDMDFPDVSKQAVSKARQGILSSLFQSLFDHSVDIFYHSIEKRKKWRNTYNIFAIDGSRICIPSSKSNFQKYGKMFSKKDEKRRWSMALCSTIYDVCNDFIVHGLIKRYLSSERDAALKHCAELEKLGLFNDSILILDRGYYSKAMFRYFSGKGYLCVMRLREGFCIARRCTGDCIQTLHGNPKDGTSDIDVRVISVPLDGGVTEYQANRAFIIANIKWFIPRFLAGVQTIDMLIDIFNDSCTVLSQIQPDRKCKRKKKNSDRERKHFNNRKRVI